MNNRKLMEEVFALPDDPGPKRVSHLSPVINRADFAAIQKFEALHPELYRDAKHSPDDATFKKQMKAQIDAFNVLFSGPHAEEFKKLIDESRQ
jgi:hypothetical protein